MTTDNGASRILIYSAVQAKYINVEPPRRLGNGALKVNTFYHDTAFPPHKVVVQTCTFPRAFLDEWKAKDTDKDKDGGDDKDADKDKDKDRVAPPNIKLAVSLRGCTVPDTPTHAFYNFYKAFEERVKDAAKANTEAWFKKKLSSDTIDDRFTSRIRHSDKYDPMVKVSLPFNNKGEPEFRIFDENRQHTSFEAFKDAIKDGAEVTLIMEAPGIWFSNKAFGPLLQARQIRFVRRVAQTSMDFAFQDDGEEPPAKRQRAGGEGEGEGQAADEGLGFA